MALNYPGPYEVRIKYTVSATGGSIQHVQRLNLNMAEAPTPGLPFEDVRALRRVDDGTPASRALDTMVDEWIALIQTQFNTSVTFDLAELWAYEPESFEASFVSTYAIGVNGTNGAPISVAGQAILTFRTLEGGVLKINLMEPINAAGAKVGMTSAPAGIQAISDYVVSDVNWILARDTSYPFAPMNFAPGQNEAIFKKRFRDT